jgi:Asp-tRNA(Asn)/Glu-tRNA(Gln) amidotransferase A subunit family amidase
MAARAAEARTKSRSDDLCYLTAAEAIEKFKRRELSPVELVEAVIQRSEEVNPKVNAYTYTFYDRALDQGREAEAKYAAGRDVRPLEGIPCVIKDLHPVEGEITTWGSKVYEGVRSEFTAPTVQRLFDAGVIMHARTTTPEFAHTGHCHSPLWGITRNPLRTTALADRQAGPAWPSPPA